MTTIESAPAARVAEIDGVPMSGLLAVAEQPRAVVVALHGGATDSAYFDCPGHPELSLLRTGPARGFTVLALDRPGYGASRPLMDEFTRPERRVDAALAAIDAHLDSLDLGAGIFLWGHSLGCELTMRLAVEPRERWRRAARRDRGLLGIALAGTGREHHADACGILGTEAQYADPKGVYGLIWAHPEIYPPELVGGAPIASRTPSYEATVTASWPHTEFPQLAARVEVPVHFTAAEHERVWRGDPEALDDIAAIFTAAPRVELHTQPDAGHNLALGYAAASYHATVLSFVQECIDNRSADRISDTTK
ncbi:alpha/beta hydrolase [Rhodococcus sp. NPDC003383]